MFAALLRLVGDTDLHDRVPRPQLLGGREGQRQRAPDRSFINPEFLWSVLSTRYWGGDQGLFAPSLPPSIGSH